MSELHKVAQQMVQKGKGILAADESTGTCTSRFESIGVESTSETRNFYRNMLFTTPELEKYISGVILFDETFRQHNLEKNIPFPEYLQSKGILPGIKVDTGAQPMESSSYYNDKLTSGLNGLENRLAEYYNLGARFAKWRAVIQILSSDECIYENAEALAKYASLCQQYGLVPIVEPEVLMDGDHHISSSYAVTEKTLETLFRRLEIYEVDLKGIVLKPNMVLYGYDNRLTPSSKYDDQVSETIRCLDDNVPGDVPGIAFLSGGQSPEEATWHLSEMNQHDLDWNLTFSYGRALQQPALHVWGGENKNSPAAQDALFERAKANGSATI